MPDLGNPNFFTTFKGRYKVTPAEGVTVDNDIVMLTSNNIVCICGDFELAVIPHHFNEIREPDPGKTAFRAERNRDPAFKRGCFPPFPFVAAA